TQAQAYQLRWHISRMADKHHIVCLHGVHIATFDPPTCSGLGRHRTDSLDWLCGVERDDQALWEGHSCLTERSHHRQAVAGAHCRWRVAPQEASLCRCLQYIERLETLTHAKHDPSGRGHVR